MNEIMSLLGQWLRPSAGCPRCSGRCCWRGRHAAGHLVQRHTACPRWWATRWWARGRAGRLFSGAVWPLQGIGLFLLELGVAMVLFECGGRIPLRWFRHNPMVLVQSVPSRH
jgi:hypothetical protein